MISSIRFPPEQTEVFERDCIQFPAIVDTDRIKCLISHEALMGYFGAGPNGMMQTFELNRRSIEVVAQAMILRGEIQDGELLMTTKAFR